MSEEYEVRGVLEAVVEHDAERREPLAPQIALFSAVLATVGVVVSLAGSHTQNDALYDKNEAVLLKARASDTWSYYQAEQIKRHLIENVGSHDGDAAAKIAAYAAPSLRLQGEAQALDSRSEEADAESQRALRPHVKLSVAMTFIQIAIALASITALTRRRWLFGLAGLSAAVGCILTAIAWL